MNWFGHKVGYRNFDSDDNSKNTLVFDVLTMGELFQNNHHKWGQSPNFAVRWFEIDPAYQAIRVFAALGIIDMRARRRRAGSRGGRRQSRPRLRPSSFRSFRRSISPARSADDRGRSRTIWRATTFRLETVEQLGRCCHT